jgi:hypothetical protein
VPEGPSNIEIAHQLHERAEAEAPHRHSRRGEFFIEIGEALLLALVAVVTAWSGYQAARWDGREAKLYGESSKIRFRATFLNTRGGQKQIYDSTTVNYWLQAKLTGNEKLARAYTKRFLPEFRPAFRAWLKTDPLHNPNAPAGPIFMPQYHNTLQERASALDARATEVFDQGTKSRETGDKYVRATVLLATVLFLIALSQRFRLHGVRVAILTVALVILAIVLGVLITYPRL